jgi:hypothetical protein
MPPPHELLNVRRGSLAAVSDAPSSPRNYSPSGQPQSQRGLPNQQWQSRASPVISHPSPQSIHGQIIPPAASPSDAQIPNQNAIYEDPIEAQKKIMKQTREQAIKRRQDAEAKEEAERKERIRLKLEAMGPLPEKKGKKEAPKEDKPVPTQIQTREIAGAQSKASPSGDASEAKAGPPSTVDKSSPSSSTQPKTTEQIPTTESRTNGAREVQLPAAAPHPPQDGRAAQWQGNPPTSDRYKPWAAPSTQQQPSRNVWGPPTNDRTLGNGTFNPELSRLPEMHQPTRPSPIGPPNVNNGGSQYQARGRDQYSSRPAPIGPPNRQQALSAEDQAKRAAVASSGWASLPEKLAKEDALAAQQRGQELAQRREQQAQGIVPEAPRPVIIQETWRKIEINSDGTRGKAQQNISATHDVGSNVNVPEEPTTRGIFEESENSRRPHLDGAGSQPPFNDAWRQSTLNVAPPVRGSRFFPAHRDVRLEDPNVTFGRPSSPSPPPPTMAGHPAYDGDSAHPTVSLPRPAPVVKLPPAAPIATIAPPRPVSFAAAVAAPAHSDKHNNSFASQQGFRATSHSQDARQQDSGSWEKKIKDLLNPTSSRTHVPAVAIDSSSKSALEHQNLPAAATVSLPSSGTGDLASDDGSIESKPAAEVCFEEQEMGSLPNIKVPSKAPAAAWELAPPPPALPRKFQVSPATSAEQLHFPQSISHDRNTRTIQIKVPGQDEAKVVTVTAAPRQKSNPRPRGGRGGRGSHNRGGRGGRDTSSGYPSPNLDNASVSSSPNSSGRGGRGGRGGYGSNSNWNRHTPTPVHT